MRARLFPLFIAVAVGVVGCRQPLAPDRSGTPVPTLAPEQQADRAEETKSARPKVSTPLQTLADRSARERRPIAAIARELHLRTQGERVQVQVRTLPAGQKAAQAAIAAVGGEATGATSDGALVQGWVPVAALDALAAYPDVLFIEGPTYMR